MKDTEAGLAIAIGYSLKVIKNKKNFDKFQCEFDAIKHGDYKAFIQYISSSTIENIESKMVVGNIDTMKVKTFDFSGGINQNNKKIIEDCDFAGFLASGPFALVFYKKCYSYFGDINDADFDDELYRKLAMFEISLRMHAKNNNLTGSLDEIINKLKIIFNFTSDEMRILHEGKRFINKIKHHKSNASMSWKQNVNLFEKAYDILGVYEIRVFN